MSYRFSHVFSSKTFIGSSLKFFLIEIHFMQCVLIILSHLPTPLRSSSPPHSPNSMSFHFRSLIYFKLVLCMKHSKELSSFCVYVCVSMDVCMHVYACACMCAGAHGVHRLMSCIFNHYLHYCETLLLLLMHVYAQIYWLSFSLWIVLALTLKSIQHISEFSDIFHVFIPVQYCFDYCSFVVSFKIMWAFSHLQFVLAISLHWDFINFRIDFPVFTKSVIITLWVLSWLS